MKAVGIAALVVALCCTVRAQGGQSADETRIRQLIADQESAWNRGNASDYCRRFQAEGVYTALAGTTFGTRGAFEDRVRQTLTGAFKGSTIAYFVRSIRFVGPEVAIVQVDTETSAFTALPAGVKASADGRFRTNTLQVMVKDGGEWWIAAYHNVDVKGP